MSKQKDKGTRRETAVVRLFQSFGLKAERAANNLQSRDVDLTLHTGEPFAIEVKDRQQLNLHKELAQVATLWQGRTPAVVWHKTEKREGAAKSSPVGPTLIALRLQDFARLMAKIGESDGLETEGALPRRGPGDVLPPGGSEHP